MGNWKIEIEGIGAHYNHVESDADAIARDMVKFMKREGQTITRATFVSATAEDITDNDSDQS